MTTGTTIAGTRRPLDELRVRHEKYQDQPLRHGALVCIEVIGVGG